MPAPNPRRHRAIKYLQHGFPHKEDLVFDNGEVYPYQVMREAVASLRDCNPELLKVLNYYAYNSLSRARIAEELGYDCSTVKRAMDKAVDVIMNRVVNDLMPDHLIEVRVCEEEAKETFTKVINPRTGVVDYIKHVVPARYRIDYRKYPQINFRLD